MVKSLRAVAVRSFVLVYIGWSTNPTDRVMLAFSIESDIQLLLPAVDGNGSTLNLVVSVRDRYDCVTEVDFASVTVDEDVTLINQFVDYVQTHNDTSVKSFFAGQLSSDNQNRRSQAAVTLSQHFTLASLQAVQTAVTQGGIRATEIAISSLGEQTQQTVSFLLVIALKSLE